MKRLENKIAIVTGAAGGIGKAIALLFAKEGAKVLATDVQDEKLNEWITSERPESLEIAGMLHDVSSKASWQKVVDKAIALYGIIHILVNNAGVYPPGLTMDDTDDAVWNRTLAINLSGPFLGTRACLPFMRQAGGGSIVNISSIAGLVGGNGAAYSASKAGLTLLTKDNAVEFAKDNIRVNSIHPGGVLTPMTEFIKTAANNEDIIKNICPMGRMGTDMEIANGALFLASDDSSYVTGAELVIDGGMTAR